MGNHQTQLSEDITTSINRSVIDSTTNCINYSVGGNSFIINGDNNVVDGVDQTVSASIAAACQSNATMGQTVNNSISDALSQQLTTASTAMMDVMDNTSNNITSVMENTIITSNLTETAVNCINKLSSTNLMTVSGDSNVISSLIQNSVSNIIGGCMQQSSELAATANTVANTATQQGKDSSSNPLNFLSTIAEAIVGSIVALLAIIFIVIVCIAYVFPHLNKKDKLAAKVALAQAQQPQPIK